MKISEVLISRIVERYEITRDLFATRLSRNFYGCGTSAVSLPISVRFSDGST